MTGLTRRTVLGSTLAAGIAGCVTPVRASDFPPAYQPRVNVSGTISLWGHGSYGGETEFMEGLVGEWQSEFQRYHPEVVFENCMYGTASAIGSLYTGRGDIALMGREIWPSEITAYREVFGHDPFGVDIVTGSHDVRNKGYAITIFKHRSNPLTGLTLAQLDAIFSAECRRGLAPIRTWGDAGLRGVWRDRPVNVYGIDISRGFARYVEEAVFLNGRIWNPEIRDFADLQGSKGGATDGGQIMLDAMAADPAAIGYAGRLYSNPEVVPVPVSFGPGMPFVRQTRETVRTRQYPLTRTITLYLNSGRQSEAKNVEFVRYLLSGNAQQAVSRHQPGYLPLTSAIAAAQTNKLETI